MNQKAEKIHGIRADDADLTDSSEDTNNGSGSDFDELYYANKPSPVPIRNRIIISDHRILLHENHNIHSSTKVGKLLKPLSTTSNQTIDHTLLKEIGKYDYPRYESFGTISIKPVHQRTNLLNNSQANANINVSQSVSHDAFREKIVPERTQVLPKIHKNSEMLNNLAKNFRSENIPTKPVPHRIADKAIAPIQIQKIEKYSFPVHSSSETNPNNVWGGNISLKPVAPSLRSRALKENNKPEIKQTGATGFDAAIQTNVLPPMKDYNHVPNNTPIVNQSRNSIVSSNVRSSRISYVPPIPNVTIRNLDTVSSSTNNPYNEERSSITSEDDLLCINSAKKSWFQRIFCCIL